MTLRSKRAQATSNPLLEGNALPFNLDVPRNDIVQVIDTAVDILAASGNATDQPLFPGQPDAESFTARVDQVGSEEYRFHIETDRGTGSIIIVGTALDQVDTVGDDTRNAFLLALPLLTIFVGGVVWVVIGRALHPVEAMRAVAADIGGNELHRRVASPGTDDEIGRLATTMNEMLDRIEASSNAQARFVSDASHELRTPIAVIRHQLEIALRRREPRCPTSSCGRRLRREPSYAAPGRRPPSPRMTGQPRRPPVRHEPACRPRRHRARAGRTQQRDSQNRHHPSFRRTSALQPRPPRSSRAQPTR